MSDKIIDYKYKERTPTETINIIKNFFAKKGFEVKEIASMKTEANTYSCHLQLFYRGIPFLYSNGKGMTEELSFASGYAELYERFCNHCPSELEKNNFEKIIQYRLQEKGYKIDPEEIVLDIDDIMKKDYISDMFEVNPLIDKDKLKEYLLRLTDNDPIGIPYTNILTDEIEYFNFRLLYAINGSTGMVAGNTFEEAFVQGMCEIFERYCTYDTMVCDGGFPYKVISLDHLENPELKRMVFDIKNKGLDVYLIDLSFEYSLPVVMGIVVNKITHASRIDFGCYPVFSIAAERAITELYQNLEKFDAVSGDLVQLPHRAVDAKDLMINLGLNVNKEAFLPDGIFDKMEFVSSINEEAYLPETATLSDCYYYIKSLIEKNQLDVFVKDNSKSSEMYALHIFAKNLLIYSNAELRLKNLGEDELIGIEDTFNICDIFRDSIRENKELDINILQNLVDNYLELPQFSIEAAYYINRGDTITPLFWNSCSFLEIARDLLELNVMNDNFLKKYRSSWFYPCLKKYFTIFRYKEAYGYTNSELIRNLKHLGIDATLEDLNNYDNPTYLLKQIIFENSRILFNSEDFQSLLKQCV